MEGKLKKIGNEYKLYAQDDSCIATTHESPYKKLSIKNCEAIANGYDLNELAREACDITDPLRLDSQKYKQDPYFKIGFNKGFQKTLEILGDKKFSEEDIRNAMERVWYWHEDSQDKDCPTLYELIPKHIQSLQQNEWDVEIEMEQYVKYVPKSLATVFPTGGVRPKLDSDGCLILKRK